MKTFLKYFHEWINNMNENVNYFSNLDDFDSKCLMIQQILTSKTGERMDFLDTFFFSFLQNIYREQTKIYTYIKYKCKKIFKNYFY